MKTFDRKDITERQIQNDIISYLKYKGFYTMRMNSGKYSIGEGRNRRFVQGHDAGTPDILAFKMLPLGVKGGWVDKGPCVDAIKLLFIEVKRKGNKPTPLQAAKMEELEKYGAKCIVATCTEDLEKAGI